ncbi:MAG: hypothetical protein Q9163_004577 [Psora crenata]
MLGFPAHKDTVVTATFDEPGTGMRRGPYSVRKLRPVSYESSNAVWFSPSLDSASLLASTVTALITWAVYFWYEVQLVRNAQNAVGQKLWRMWITVAGELGVLVPEYLVSLEVIFLFIFRKRGPPNRYLLVGDEAPSVDVFIPCCGEDIDVIMDTVKAAASQDYPSHRYRVFVLDDKKNASLEREVATLKNRSTEGNGPPVIYVARRKVPGVRHHFKAGNLWNGIEVSSALGKGSEYFASLDADMITSPDWLRRLIPHLIMHPEIALVCPSQHFYNIPEDDPLGQDSYVYKRIFQPLRDRVGASSCTGSGYVARRSAIQDIGGLPLVDVSEDIMFTYLLEGAGWDVVCLDEEVQLGLAPDSYAAYLKQRMRWLKTSAGGRIGLRLPTAGVLPPHISSSETDVHRSTGIFATTHVYQIRDGDTYNLTDTLTYWDMAFQEKRLCAIRIER